MILAKSGPLPTLLADLSVITVRVYNDVKIPLALFSHGMRLDGGFSHAIAIAIPETQKIMVR